MVILTRVLFDLYSVHLRHTSQSSVDTSYKLVVGQKIRSPGMTLSRGPIRLPFLVISLVITACMQEQQQQQ